METFIAAIDQHGYGILFAIVFLEAIGFPIPAALALLFAGGASVKGPLHPAATLATALGALFLGDSLLYTAGRFAGWGLLQLLCRLSLNPESCVLRSADAFYRRGRVLLLFAKFVPGINTMAAPLAGSMNLPLVQFLPLDFLGSCLYAGAYFSVGFLFRDLLTTIARGYSVVGSAMGWLVGALILAWITNRSMVWWRSRNQAPVTRLGPAQVQEMLDEGRAVIFDVRSHGYYEKNAMRIKGSARIEPNAISSEMHRIPKDHGVILYCT